VRRTVFTATLVVGVATAVGLATFAFASQGAANSPWLAGLQQSVPKMSFADCQRQSFPALKAEGLTAQYKGPTRSWYGRSTFGVSGTIFCYEGPDGLVWVTIVAASDKPNVAVKTALELRRRLHGTGGGPVTSGTYEADVRYGGTVYKGTVILKVSGGRVTGTMHFGCCPGTRTDPIQGTVNGDELTFTRDCSGQGAAASCSQTWSGKTTGPGRIEGNATGSGGSGTFTFIKTS
jgi:hypothetical protein